MKNKLRSNEDWTAFPAADAICDMKRAGSWLGLRALGCQSPLSWEKDSFLRIAGAVMGKRLSAALNDRRQTTKDAIEELLKYYHVKAREVPRSIKDMNEILEFLLRPYGIMRRNVSLDGPWHKDATGAMLGTRKDDGSVVALIPSGFSGYSFFDVKNGARAKVNHIVILLYCGL